MKILFVGPCMQDHVIHWYEALTQGLREVSDTRMFGQGYPGFDPQLTTYPQILAHVFPEGAPDLMITWGIYGPREEDCLPRFPYQGILEVKIPKAMVVTDFWYYTERHPQKLLDCIEAGGYQYVLATFRHLCDLYRHSRFSDRFLHLPFCFDSGTFRDWQEPKQFDIGFYGAGISEPDAFYRERAHFHQLLTTYAQATGRSYHHLPHPGYGRVQPGHPMVGEGFSRQINRCRIHVVTGGKYHLPFAKCYETMASRTLLLATEPEGAEALGLIDGVTYVKVTEDTLLERIEHYLQHPEAMEAILQRAYEVAHTRHSATARARQLIQRLQSPPEPAETVTDLGHAYQQGHYAALLRHLQAHGPNPAHAYLRGQAHAHLGEPALALAAFTAPAPPAALDPADFEPFGSEAEIMTESLMPGSIRAHWPVLHALVVGLKAKRIVDLGIGGTTKVIRTAARLTGGVVHSCDYDRPRFQALLNHQTEHWKLALCPSSAFLREMEGPIDFAMHDAAHDLAQVREDLSHLLPKMRTFGMIAIHDTHEPEFRTELIDALQDLARQHPLSFTTLPYACGLTLVRVEASPYAPLPIGDFLRDGRTLNAIPFPHPLVPAAGALATEPAPNSVFILNTDWGGHGWIEVVLAYLLAFEPGDPVLLVLYADQDTPEAKAHDQHERMIMDLARHLGKTSFADVTLLDQPKALLDTLREFNQCQWIPANAGDTGGLHGPFGQRLAQARHAVHQGR